MSSSGHELPRWLWLWAPLLFLVFLLIANLIDQAFFQEWIQNEQGLVELATPLVLVFGMIYGARIPAAGRLYLPVWIRLWVVAVTLACLYFAGEELSWGQQLFGWSTPESIGRINDQNETNIHNVSSWFDQKPRLLLELWVLIGGIILPALRIWKNDHLIPGSWQYWFLPGSLCLPSALIAILVKIPERIKDVFGLSPFSYEIRWSEAQELYFAAFLSLYLASIYVRLRQRDA